MSKLAEALRQCEEVLALGYQTGPYAYAGEDIKRYMAEARDAARAALAEHDAAPQPQLPTSCAVVDYSTIKSQPFTQLMSDSVTVNPQTAAPPAQPVPVEKLLEWAVLDGVIGMSKVFDPDLQDALEKFAARFAAPPAQPVALTDAERTDALISAAEERAALYEGDERQDIKTDVMNAFFAGAKFAAGKQP
jgi:hypothetical protein